MLLWSLRALQVASQTLGPFQWFWSTSTANCCTQFFAQAAHTGNKYATPVPPIFPHPPSVNPLVLYINMCQLTLLPKDILDAAYATVGKNAVGFQVFLA